MNRYFFFVLVLALAVLPTSAAAENLGALWGWNISAGGNFGFGLKADLTTSGRSAAMVMPKTISTTDKKVYDPTRANPYERVDFASGGYIDPNSEVEAFYPGETINWGLPVSTDPSAPYALKGSNPYVRTTEIVNENGFSAGDSGVAYGASVDLSHVLYVSADGSWGIDIAFGLTWMRSYGFYEQNGGLVASQRVEEGDFETTVRNGWIESGNFDPNDDGTWGGQAATQGEAFDAGRYPTRLDMTTATYAYNPDGTRTRTESLTVNARGDYEEWEIAAMLKPWYDINDWLCVHGILGVGLTRSSFDYSMDAVFNGKQVYQSSQEFHEWRCYGIAGGGVLVRAWDFDVSCDGLFRWCQQDMKIDGKDVQGTLQKPWGVLRLGLSYAF